MILAYFFVCRKFTEYYYRPTNTMRRSRFK